jgi:hypothetical protein
MISNALILENIFIIIIHLFFLLWYFLCANHLNHVLHFTCNKLLSVYLVIKQFVSCIGFLCLVLDLSMSSQHSLQPCPFRIQWNLVSFTPYRGSRVQFPAGAGNFSLHHCIQNSSGAHPASYPVGTRDFLPGGEADHSPPSSATFKNWVKLYLQSPIMPSWHGAQLKHRDNFTFYTL